MARIVLLSATAAEDENSEHRRPLRGLQESAALDKFGEHALTDDPETSAAIIFAESYGAGWHFERVREHAFTQRYREKCFIFSSNPFVIPFLPGVYSSIGRRWASSRTAAGFYVGQPPNEFTTYSPPEPGLPYLYSFMGSIKNAPVRRNLARLSHPRSLFHDTSADFARLLQWKMSQRERRDYQRRYAELTKASKFILCPRGMSVSSIRLFETMRMGRVPVILSDGWRPPRGPDWKKFSIRVREKKFAQLPRLLEEREAEAEAMGELARATWEDWFSEEAAFHRVVEACLEIRARRIIPESVRRWPVYLQYLRPFHFRRLLGRKLRALRGAEMRPDSTLPGETTTELREQSSRL